MIDLEPYRVFANDALAHARERNASSEHPESLKLAAVAAKILTLCDEIERLQASDVPPPPDAVHEGEDQSEPTTKRRAKKS